MPPTQRTPSSATQSGESVRAEVLASVRVDLMTQSISPPKQKKRRPQRSSIIGQRLGCSRRNGWDAIFYPTRPRPAGVDSRTGSANGRSDDPATSFANQTGLPRSHRRRYDKEATCHVPFSANRRQRSPSFSIRIRFRNKPPSPAPQPKNTHVLLASRSRTEMKLERIQKEKLESDPRTRKLN